MGRSLRLGYLSLILLFSFTNSIAAKTTDCDQIVGKWISEEKNFIVEVLKDGDNFKAVVLWFDDSDDKTRPMNVRTDYKNPDKNLRNRKIIGLSVLKNLTYNVNSHSWEGGVIYDAKNGHEWNSCAKLLNDGSLKVTGYWHFKFIGKSMNFTRLAPNDKMLLTSR